MINVRLNLYKKKKFNNLKNRFNRDIKNTNINNIVSIDESSFDTHIHANYGWSLKGTPIEVIKKKPRERFSVISGITNKKVIYTELVKGSVNKVGFTGFMSSLPDSHA